MPLISLFSWLFTIRLFSLYCIFYYFFTTLVFHTPLTVVLALLLIIEMFSIRLSEAKENRMILGWQGRGCTAWKWSQSGLWWQFKSIKCLIEELNSESVNTPWSRHFLHLIMPSMTTLSYNEQYGTSSWTGAHKKQCREKEHYNWQRKAFRQSMQRDHARTNGILWQNNWL